jgi:hypothetical protein
MTNDVSFYREQLEMAVSSSSEWRAEKAAQYPNDKRNISSCESLAKLAKKLEALPLNNPHLVAYAEMMERAIELEDVVTRISEIESPYIGRYGFDYPQTGAPAAFLKGLTQEIATLVEEEEERVKEEKLEADYEEAKEAADEAAKEAADEAAKEAAEEAAKEAAEEAYKEAYEETYKEAYEEAYKEALIEALQR